MLKHPEKESGLSHQEKNSLAREASFSSWGKSRPEYEDAWKKYWYHEED
jgi:hypothetical protein